jgi:hypothetical protein
LADCILRFDVEVIIPWQSLNTALLRDHADHRSSEPTS